MNMLVRGIPALCKAKIERMARAKNLSANQLVVQFVIQGTEVEGEKEKTDARQRKAIRRLRQMREEMYKKYGLSNDSTQIIREARDGRNRDL